MVKEQMSLMEVVSALERQQLVLPLFQRPFVWSEEKVCDLFDSLWQGYPIGCILLLEQAPPDLRERLQCCAFCREAGNQYLEQSLQQRRSEARIFEKFTTASHVVLDGQQRLFAFYIGIAGAYLRPSHLSNSHGNYESAKLYFDLYPLVKLFFKTNGDLKCLHLEHHQFCFLSDSQLVHYQEQIRQELGNKLSLSPLLPLSLVQNWGRDRRTAKAAIRSYLKQLASLPKKLLDEFEDMLYNLHNYVWVSKSVNNSTVAPSSSYDLLEIFSRLNQGSSFSTGDLHYAVRIVFPENSPNITDGTGHNFSQHLANSLLSSNQPTAPPNTVKTQPPQAPKQAAKDLAEISAQEQFNAEIFHELNPGESASHQQVHHNFTTEDLEEIYQRLGQTTEELKISLDFFYHCYLFCESKEPEHIAQNIRKKEGALALRNNGAQLLRVAEALDNLRDAIDACNFIVRHWFADHLHNQYVVLPVVYFFYKKIDKYLDPLNDLENVNLSRMVRWIALNEVVSPSVFAGGQGQLVRLLPLLHKIMRNAANDSPNGSRYFPLGELQQHLTAAFGHSGSLVKPGKELRSLALTNKNIADLLENTQMQKRTCVPLLALLYSHPQRIALMQRYEERQISFIQPKKLLSKNILKSYGLAKEQVELFFSWRDSVLNLQWLPKRLQTEKGDIPFSQWLENSQQLQFLGEQNQFRKKDLIVNFLRFHHIKTEDGIYTINAFERFLAERKKMLYRALKQYGQDFGNWDTQAKMPQIDYPAF